MTSISMPASSNGWRRNVLSMVCLGIVIFFILRLNLLCFEKINLLFPLEEQLTETMVSSGKLRIPQDDPKLLAYIRRSVLVPPATSGPVLVSGRDVHFKKTYEQQQVYRFILNLLKNKTNGFFVECGAHDGEFYSNTLPLEMRQGWTGLLVEADPFPLKTLLLRNRRAWIAPVCLSPNTFPIKVTMKQHKSTTGWTYLSGWGKSSGGKEFDYNSFQAQCFPLFSILKAIDITTVDYFSLDIEGAELSVLKTIPWQDVLIRTLSIEVNQDKAKALNDYMTSVGYTFITHIKNGFSHDNIYAHSAVLYSQPLVD